MRAREAAVDALTMWEGGGFRGTDIMRSTLKVSVDDESLFIRIFYGTLRRLITIDRIIEAVSGVSVNNMQAVTRNSIRVAVYQIVFLKAIPDRISVDAAVKIAMRFGRKEKNFTNAVLRNICRAARGAGTECYDDDGKPASIPAETFRGVAGDHAIFALRHSVTDWFARELVKHYGKLQAEEIAFWSNVGQMNCSRAVASSESIPGLTESAVLSRESSAGQAQDQASVAVGDVVASLAKPGQVIADLCAAPGGKTAHLAVALPGSTIMASDISEKRLKVLKENCSKFANVRISLADARKVRFEKCPEIILLDVPCSNSGVLYKRPDAKYRLKYNEISRLQKIQIGLLKSVLARFKESKFVVYSTCSILPHENRWAVEQALGDSPHFHIKEEIQFLPSRSTAGAYVAVLTPSAGNVIRF